MFAYINECFVRFIIPTLCFNYPGRPVQSLVQGAQAGAT